MFHCFQLSWICSAARHTTLSLIWRLFHSRRPKTHQLDCIWLFCYPFIPLFYCLFRFLSNVAFVPWIEHVSFVQYEQTIYVPFVQNRLPFSFTLSDDVFTPNAKCHKNNSIFCPFYGNAHQLDGHILCFIMKFVQNDTFNCMFIAAYFAELLNTK